MSEIQPRSADTDIVYIYTKVLYPGGGRHADRLYSRSVAVCIAVIPTVAAITCSPYIDGA